MAEDEVLDEEFDEDDEESSGGGGGGKKKLIIIIIVIILLLGGLGVGAMLLFGGKSKKSETILSSAQKTGKLVNAEDQVGVNIFFFKMPKLMINIRSNGGESSLLGIAITLEIKGGAQDFATVQSLAPRLNNRFEVFLRQLRKSDLEGSSGLLRLREEMLDRANVAASPIIIKDVLIREFIIK